MLDAAWSLDGKVAVVTGASRGLGAAIAVELGRWGAHVVAVARTADALADTVATIHAAGGSAHAVVADVATDAGVAAVVADVAARFPAVHVLVNNVGTNHRAPTLEVTRDAWEALVATNLTSAWMLTRALHPQLLAAQGASVVQVSSVSSVRAVRTSTAIYAMTKGGLDAMTMWLASAWGPDQIRVNGVAPWYVRTPLAEPVLADPTRRDAILARTPLGRVGEPHDVARAVAFLASPASAWITGVTLPVDGGFMALGV